MEHNAEQFAASDSHFICDPTPETPTFALMYLQITMTHLLGMVKAEGPDSDAAKAIELLEQASEILSGLSTCPEVTK